MAARFVEWMILNLSLLTYFVKAAHWVFLSTPRLRNVHSFVKLDNTLPTFLQAKYPVFPVIGLVQPVVAQAPNNALHASLD